MKYLIIKKRGLELPVIFSEIESHDEVAKKLNVFSDTELVSAGFCRFEMDENGDGTAALSVRCWGKSVSLGIQSRPEDDYLIYKQNQFEI